MGGKEVSVHALNGDVVLRRHVPAKMQVWEIKKQCHSSSSPRLMSLTLGNGQNNVVLRDNDTLESVPSLVTDAELALALTVRPLKVLIFEGMGMIGPDHNADTDSVLEALGELEADSEDESMENGQPYKETLRDEFREVTCFKYDPNDNIRINEAKAAIMESDVTVLCESHVCPWKVSADLSDTLTQFVQNGGWFLHTGAIDSESNVGNVRLFPSLFVDLPQRRCHSTKAASVDHRKACMQINPMFRMLQWAREGAVPMSEHDKKEMETECAKYGFEVQVPEGDHANACACPTDNANFETLFPDSASLELPGNFLCFREEELNPAHAYFRMSSGYGVPVVSMRHGGGRVTSFGALPNHRERTGFPFALALAAHIWAAQSLVGTGCNKAAALQLEKTRGQKRLTFQQGMQVQAIGLSRRADLNGKVGTVKGKKTGSDNNLRIVVAFTVDGVEESMMCRPENLKDFE